MRAEGEGGIQHDFNVTHAVFNTSRCSRVLASEPNSRKIVESSSEISSIYFYTFDLIADHQLFFSTFSDCTSLEKKKKGENRNWYHLNFPLFSGCVSCARELIISSSVFVVVCVKKAIGWTRWWWNSITNMDLIEDSIGRLFSHDSPTVIVSLLSLLFDSIENETAHDFRLADFGCRRDWTLRLRRHRHHRCGCTN